MNSKSLWKLINEDGNSDTIPASKSGDESKFNADIAKLGGKWGSTDSMKAQTPVEQRAASITKELKDGGYLDDPKIAKAANVKLAQWLAKIPPEELMVKTPKDLSVEFLDTMTGESK